MLAGQAIAQPFLVTPNRDIVRAVPPVTRFYVAFLLPVLTFGQACKPDQLSVAGELRGAGLGHNYGRVIVQNVSQSACQLEGVPRGGYPGRLGQSDSLKNPRQRRGQRVRRRVERLSPQTRRFRGRWTVQVSANYEENVCGIRCGELLNGKAAVYPKSLCG